MYIKIINPLDKFKILCYTIYVKIDNVGGLGMADIYEGIFWKINGELVTFADMIQPNNACATRLNHIKTWEEIKHKYLVDDEEVAYNYFPRGRITARIAPTLTNNIALDVYIYLCKCSLCSLCFSEHQFLSNNRA